MKIIKITFKNAKLFPYEFEGKDFVVDQNIRSQRSEQLMFKEPITVHQISNMLHKMMGERPVPSFRFACYKRQNDIFELAQKSYLKINSVRIFNKFKETDEFIKEFFQIKKSVYNGWNPIPNIFWGKVEKMMDEFYNEFIERFSKLMGYDVLSKPFLDYKACGLNTDKFNELTIWLKSVGKTPIANFLTLEKSKITEITQNGKLGETAVRGVGIVNILSGVIYVPVEDKDLDRFIYNTATILDGGLATIDGVYEDYDLGESTLDDFRLISEISDEKIMNAIY